MEFEIKEGIPLPIGRGKPRKYDIPLEDRKKGDHIKIDMAKSKISSESKIIRNFALRLTHKQPDYKFTIRQLDDGVGIWRV